MKKILSIAILLLIFISCSKEKQKINSKLNIEFIHNVGFETLKLDPLSYLNEAGTLFSVTDLHYYISNITFINEKNNDSVFDDLIHYIDIKKNETTKFYLPKIPYGTYNIVKFDLGIDSIKNIFGYLENNIDNQNMYWPETMGGGYHFLRFEGKYFYNGNYLGFAFHLGKSKMKIHYEIPINKVINSSNSNIVFVHDILEWFKNPLTYDLTIFETYSMNNDSVMNVIKINGSDVFKVK